MKKLLIFLVLIFGIAPPFLKAQKVTIKKVELAGEKIIVYYELDDTNPNNEYLLKLYTSKDNFTVPLTKVKGDVGSEIRRGAEKKIEWNIREEYGGYKGKLALEIRAKVYVPFVKLQNFDAKMTYKRGKQYEINWKAGNTNPVHIELFKGSQRVQGDMNHPNNGTYTMSLSSKAKPGKDYRLKITDSKSSDEIVYTDFFKVSPKIPLPVKVLGVLAIAGGGIMAATAGGGEGGGTPPSNQINLPPLPGN